VDFLSVDAFEPIRAEICARGAVNVLFKPPKATIWQVIGARGRGWGQAYVQYGGDVRKAAKESNYATPPHLIARRFFKEDDPASRRMRSYISACNDSLKDALIQNPAVYLLPELPTLAPEDKPDNIAIEQPPVYLPAMIPAEIIDTKEGERDTEAAKRIWRNAGSYTLKDFVTVSVDAEGKRDWEWDLEAVRNAPPGVVARLSKDGRGRTQVELADALGAAKELANHWKPKENEGGRVDIRSVVVNILQSGDPAERYRLDDLARKAAERLKADREKRALVG
jgi:hypothetical protein